jgi:ribosomal protein L40E
MERKGTLRPRGIVSPREVGRPSDLASLRQPTPAIDVSGAPGTPPAIEGTRIAPGAGVDLPPRRPIAWDLEPNSSKERHVSRTETCPECGASLQPRDQTCQKCGHPLSFEVDEADVPCGACDAPIGVRTETCPSCGENGYPALRPRRSKGFKGSPALETRRATESA